ncbi:MAG: PAS domain-containing sensor histidine kinase [Oscillatoriales cyanobacterium]|nr:MAG: PAS domain-containing sensor histidine kinase [Oscillatoriales cyanobacterium]
MHLSNDHRLQTCQEWASYLAITASGVGAMVILGWLLDIDALKQVLPGLVSMKFNTALSVSLLGGSLSYWLLAPRSPTGQLPKLVRGVLLGSASLTFLIGALTILQYQFKVSYGIDQLIIQDDTSVIGTSHPGRMALNTAVVFVSLGIAWFLFGLPRLPRRGFYVVQGFLGIGALVSLLGLLGYAYQVQSFYGLSTYTRMALHTAVALFLLSIAGFLATANWGWMADMTSSYAGGVMARQLTVYALLLPLILGWVVLHGFRHNAFNSAMGIAFFVVFNLVILAISIAWVARQLNRIDQARQRSASYTESLYQDLAIKADLLEAVNQSLKQEIRDRERAEASEAELQRLLKQLQETQMKLVQSEKMSSLGQLVSGIAHEINNPVNFIYGNVAHAKLYTAQLLAVIAAYRDQNAGGMEVQYGDHIIDDQELDFIIEDFSQLISSMEVGASRIRKIVTSLRNFARLDEADYKQVDLHEGINNTLIILGSRLKYSKVRSEITVQKNYGNLPLVTCYPGQLNQAIMNLIANAIDALEEFIGSPTDDREPTIIITTESSDRQWVKIQIQDNAGGIPDSIRQRIFDPFFTTKEVGKGTGLGLSISYKIIHEKHGGRLICESQPNLGTTFAIELPVAGILPLDPKVTIAPVPLSPDRLLEGEARS